MSVTFSEGVVGVGRASFALINARTRVPVAATVRYDRTARRAVLVPVKALAADTRYVVRLTSGIKDASGNRMTPLSWVFTTGPAPTVTRRTPTPGFKTIPRTTNVTASFSERVRGVTSTSVTLVNARTNVRMSALVTYDAATRTVTLNPTRALAPLTAYRMSLTGRITDLAGNALRTTTWEFVTGRK